LVTVFRFRLYFEAPSRFLDRVDKGSDPPLEWWEEGYAEARFPLCR
jgi:hypothetical protein